MQSRVKIILAATLVRTLGGIGLGVLLWLSAREVVSQDLKVALLVCMSYIMTVSVYRMVRAVKLSKEMESFLEKLDKEDPKS